MKERERKATCNFTLSADGFWDYFSFSKRNYIKKFEQSFFGVITDSSISTGNLLLFIKEHDMKTDYLA